MFSFDEFEDMCEKISGGMATDPHAIRETFRSS